MERSLFRIPQMDCSAEESLVRMKLADLAAVVSLDFDLSARTVAVYHRGERDAIESALEALGLGSRLVQSGPGLEAPSEAGDQRRLLWTVLAINFAFFCLESAAGLLAGSMGLVADSLDMLADAIVYGLSLAAVGAAAGRKKAVARAAGYFQITLALLGLAEVLRRFFGLEEPPEFRTMIVVSTLALAANAWCLRLLGRSRDREAHIEASRIFTSNDVIINLGVIAAGLLVRWTGSSLPDLIVGAVVFGIVSLGARRILRLAA